MTCTVVHATDGSVIPENAVQALAASYVDELTFRRVGQNMDGSALIVAFHHDVRVGVWNGKRWVR